MRTHGDLMDEEATGAAWEAGRGAVVGSSKVRSSGFSYNGMAVLELINTRSGELEQPYWLLQDIRYRRSTAALLFNLRCTLLRGWIIQRVSRLFADRGGGLGLYRCRR